MSLTLLANQKMLHSTKAEGKTDYHKEILSIDQPIHHLIHQENETEMQDENKINAIESTKYHLVRVV